MLLTSHLPPYSITHGDQTFAPKVLPNISRRRLHHTTRPKTLDQLTQSDCAVLSAAVAAAAVAFAVAAAVAAGVVAAVVHPSDCRRRCNSWTAVVAVVLATSHTSAAGRPAVGVAVVVASAFASAAADSSRSRRWELRMRTSWRAEEAPQEEAGVPCSCYSCCWCCPGGVVAGS